ncbi:MAG: uncharacterized protein A8A55_2575 [Amphiamblys sp. WSBS2006]|nr:MAG: uncharacterized protein A8A55_2575 [Amphiamblys sp. WSBS2006]
MSRTKMDIGGWISLLGNSNSSVCCREGLTNETNFRIYICTNGYNKEKIENIEENTKKIQKRNISIEARDIHAEEKGVCILLKLCTVDALVCYLGITEKKYIEEILGDENQRVGTGRAKNLQLRDYAVNLLPKLVENQAQEIHLNAKYSCHVSTILEAEDRSVWIGSTRKLYLEGYAVEILPKLRFHEENVMKVIRLSADDSEQITGILETEDSSLWVGRVKELYLARYAVEILPKLRFHEENVIEEIRLFAHSSDQITGILEEEDNNVWVGRMKELYLARYAVEILPKLRFHEENVIEELLLSADDSDQITGILKTEDSSLWIGKVKNLDLREYAIEILPKLRFQEENEIEGLHLCAYGSGQVSRILETEDNSLWVGRVKEIDLDEYAIDILPKLRFHEENVMEVIRLSADKPGQINKILETEDSSLWVGRVKELYLSGYTIDILPKLRFHEENVMEVICLSADKPGQINKILETEDSSLWVGRVKELYLSGYTMEILPKLRFHEENVIEGLFLSTDDSGQISRILETEDNSLWMGKVKELYLCEYGVEILPKLGFHEEREIEELHLCPEKQEDIAGILRKENRSICLGRVKKLRLYDHALQILPKLRIHGGGRIETLLKTHSPERVAEMLGTKRNNDSTKESKNKYVHVYGGTFREVFEFKFSSRVSRKRRSGDI